MKTYLKIKVKSLGAEAKMIRQEELKFPGQHQVRIGLYHHRIDVVRTECRSASLAYGFLRGRSYRAMESKCHQAPDWKRVETIAAKYATEDKRVFLQRFAEWKDDACATA